MRHNKAELSKSFTWCPSKSKQPSRAYGRRRHHSATVRHGTSAHVRRSTLAIDPRVLLPGTMALGTNHV